MRHWRAILRMMSPLATPLTAERLFGHVCWGLSYREGPEAVADFLTRMRGENPPLVIGEPTPVGFLPMPVVLRTGQVSLDLRGKHHLVWDRYRRRGIMPQTALLRAAHDLGSPATVMAALDSVGWHNPVIAKRQMRVRSAANRINGSPLGRSEWLAVETWDQRDSHHVEVIIVSDLEVSEIERLLQIGLENGFGRAANVGYGQVELTAVESIQDWPEVADANALVTLGPCVPRQDDPVSGMWQVQAQWGKLGGGFAVQAAAADKQPVMTLESGAVLLGKVTRDYVGRLVPNVHPQQPEVVHYGMAPVIAVRI